jgi:hypothetical protein
MAGKQGKATRASLGEAIESMIDERQKSQAGKIPGEVISYDVATQIVTVRPLVSRKIGNKTLDMPEIQVKYSYPRGGGFAFHTPLKAGDPLSLEPSKHSQEGWNSGKNMNASAGRDNSHSDYMATAGGMVRDSDALKGLKGDRLHAGTQDGKSGFQMNEDGKFNIFSGDESLIGLLKELNSNTKTLVGLLGGLSPQALSISSIQQIISLLDKFTGLNSKLDGVKLDP